MTCQRIEFDSCELIDIPHCYTEGDNIDELHFKHDDRDLSGYTIKMALERDDATVVERPAIQVDLSIGKYFFRFEDTDLLPCKVLGTLFYTNPSGHKQTVARIRLTVLERPTP